MFVVVVVVVAAASLAGCSRCVVAIYGFLKSCTKSPHIQHTRAQKGHREARSRAHTYTHTHTQRYTERHVHKHTHTHRHTHTRTQLTHSHRTLKSAPHHYTLAADGAVWTGRIVKLAGQQLLRGETIRKQ